ncbi:MAG: isoprenyl transferase [Muribaculaceae bacterium]|nr:isoprenyl transferase [Muribaculaceae bacterium]
MQDITKGIDPNRIPQHVAVIMDGNGRWAKEHGANRSIGHEHGSFVVHDVTEQANELGVKYLTLYTFSTENWNRPKLEVDLLMALVVTTIERETKFMLRDNVRFGVIGDFDRLPDFAQESFKRCMADTAHCTGMRLNIAMSYSSRWEIVEACKSIAQEVKDGTLDVSAINDEVISNHLCTAGMPDPELLIRTAGDLRISNYLLWQIAYSELVFMPMYWPDFTKKDFCDAIREYQRRERRFGKTSDQIMKEQEQK